MGRHPRFEGGVFMKPTALITGGTRGIGLGIAVSMAEAGYDLVLCGRRSAENVRDSIHRLEMAGANVHYIQADLGVRSDRDHLVDNAREIFEHLHVLVNNAGMAPRERNNILEATEESFEEIIRVNLQGPFFLTQLCARWMIQSQQSLSDYRGCIININSISATVASINRGEYCISKAGVAMATKLWAVGLAPHDIPTYEIRPGITKTDMTTHVKDHYDALIDDGLLLQPRWGSPEDVGRAALMLARGDLPYSTGQVLMLDGGLTVERL